MARSEAGHRWEGAGLMANEFWALQIRLSANRLHDCITCTSQWTVLSLIWWPRWVVPVCTAQLDYTSWLWTSELFLLQLTMLALVIWVVQWVIALALQYYFNSNRAHNSSGAGDVPSITRLSNRLILCAHVLFGKKCTIIFNTFSANPVRMHPSFD